MVLWFILVLALEGLIVGALARLALPGPDPMGSFATIGLGLRGRSSAGSFRGSSSATPAGSSSRSSPRSSCSTSAAASCGTAR